MPFSFHATCVSNFSQDYVAKISGRWKMHVSDETSTRRIRFILLLIRSYVSVSRDKKEDFSVSVRVHPASGFTWDLGRRIDQKFYDSSCRKSRVPMIEKDLSALYIYIYIFTTIKSSVNTNLYS